MNKLIKQALSILIMGAMLVSMAACQNGGTSSNQGSSDSSEVKPSSADESISSTDDGSKATDNAGDNEPITFKIFAGVSPMSPDNADKPLAKQFTEATGVSIKWECISTEMMTERKNLIFATNDLPDAFMNAGLTDYELSTYGRGTDTA